MAVEIDLLGEVAVRVDGRAVELGPPKQKCLLAALAVDAGQVVPAQQLIERIWGVGIPRRERAALQSYVSRLRQILSDADTVDIVHRSGGYALMVNQPDQAVDLHRFSDLCTRARECSDDARVVRLLTQALEMWRGEALTGLTGDWVTAERDRLRQERLEVEHDLVDARLRTGQGEQMVADLSARIAQYPLDERVAGQYMLALHRAGRSADALEQYARCGSDW
ncbi:AfsR/SARP family transcriptional regulator [Actinosynnema sp. ALI-1.44]|uniref:AfsR/SARP family transcriptional regulator n=1 Tax=Actinosynnema sp. ALI-1.44 TaxID=1933779 RepID=UPI001EDC6CC7|nr:AfsR/SARP family transcriptional regulator [Actinosynnema sp. ALI-1.44]